MSRPPDKPAPTWTVAGDDAPLSDDAVRAIAALLLESVEEQEKGKEVE